jgi:hypothetical protein
VSACCGSHRSTSVCTTSGQPECFPGGRPAMLRPCRGMDVVGYDVAIIGELSPCRVRRCHSGRQSSGRGASAFRRWSGVPGIPGGGAGPRCAERPSGAGAFLLGLLSSAAEVGAVDRAELIPAESHGVLLIGFGAIVIGIGRKRDRLLQQPETSEKPFFSGVRCPARRRRCG